MDDKLQKNINQAIDAHADELHEQRLSIHSEAARDRSLRLSGGFRAAMNISRLVGSEVIRGLERFQAEECWRDLGFESFAAYLASPESPMKKSTYYDLKGLLEREGDAVFDLYANLGLKPRVWKQLGTGQVEFDGSMVRVKADDGEETEIDITDRSRLLETLTALADANAEKSIKLERQKDTLAKHDDKVRELYDEIDKAKAAKAADFAADAHMTARVELGLAFGRLTDIVSQMTDVEREALRDAVLENVAGWSTSLRMAYRTDSSPTGVPTTLVGDTFEECLDNFLDNVDLDAIADTNDAELADQL